MVDSASATFSDALLHWFDQHGRHDLPWQHPREPYRVWLSEIMLQQTQVATVVGYFTRFVEQLPDLPTLAAADPDQVMALWAGLGYYSRARNLHAAAKVCMVHHQGELPQELDQLQALPGIGRSTAAAILAQSFGQRQAILDGNVKRVLSRYHGVIGWPGSSAISKQLWQHSEQHTPERRVGDYTQAIMDLGATLCRRSKPTCDRCPLATDCVAKATNQQTELPTRKPKKSVPLKETWVLFQINQRGELLLERRPPSGIWGGLWALPLSQEIDPTYASAAAAPLRHTFSHFKLDLKPVLVSTKQAIEDSEGRWCSAEDAAKLGLPKPIRQLVELHFKDELKWQEPFTA